mgnify:CR=1 FL=1
MNRIFEIINNTFIIKKQQLEQELEETLNNQKGTSVEERVDKIRELVKQIADEVKAQEIFNSYLNQNTDGTNR